MTLAQLMLARQKKKSKENVVRATHYLCISTPFQFYWAFSLHSLLPLIFPVYLFVVAAIDIHHGYENQRNGKKSIGKKPLSYIALLLVQRSNVFTNCNALFYPQYEMATGTSPFSWISIFVLLQSYFSVFPTLIFSPCVNKFSIIDVSPNVIATIDGISEPNKITIKYCLSSQSKRTFFSCIIDQFKKQKKKKWQARSIVTFVWAILRL